MTIVERIRRYKYLPFDEGSLRIITDGTIKFTPPSKVNDPFDCAPDVETCNIAEYLNSRPDLLARAGERLNLSPAQIIEEKQTMIKRLEIAADHGAFGQQFSDSVGICSLTRDPLNLLMWAHYAQHHTGFVVEFDIPIVVTDTDKPPTESLLDWLIPQEVEYQTSKPVVSFFDDKDVTTKKQFLVKGEDWAYEQEERVIDYVRGHGIHKYDRKTVLHSVIAGMRMDDRNYMTLVESVNKANQDLNLRIEVYKTEPVKGKFELFVLGRSDLQPIKVPNQAIQPTRSTRGS
ncbi:MAG: DUF2971 domain-containing protein [Deltaproteobacteria bacterium]|nr:MAG: DUF2971 domain-containing protein [Deltaproteobacteria bacterium]